MSSKTSFLHSHSSRSVTADETGAYADFGLRERLGEHAVAAIAVTLALLFVTTIAVLMGLA